jgi:hypothetical protein
MKPPLPIAIGGIFGPLTSPYAMGGIFGLLMPLCGAEGGACGAVVVGAPFCFGSIAENGLFPIFAIAL